MEKAAEIVTCQVAWEKHFKKSVYDTLAKYLLEFIFTTVTNKKEKDVLISVVSQICFMKYIPPELIVNLFNQNLEEPPKISNKDCFDIFTYVKEE